MYAKKGFHLVYSIFIDNYIKVFLFIKNESPVKEIGEKSKH